jgi:phenylalanyl-tRNA synthetase beta chain
MQFPESWLRSFCNPDISTQQLADLLTMAGLEVEALQPVAPAFTGVVVGQVLEVAKHPDADRLNVCKVDAGTGAVLQIVCGAPNVRPGIKVPCATVGAELPPGADGKTFKIKLGKLRGVESQGMLCSAKELGIAEESNGLHILGDDAPVGLSVRDHLKLDDTLFTLKLTPNLAHCLSVAGIAREVSALTGAPLTLSAILPVAPTIDDRLPVKVEASDLCGRFAGRVIKGVNPQAATPAWMVERLARCGQRSVSPLVDISNYVMFELGQPSHVFDLDKIHGGLTVRWGRPGEQLKLLNGNTITVDAEVGVIADAQQLESLAGIMGGDATAVSDDTRNVYLEGAFWAPKAIAGRARRYNFSTDASHRFERGVDPAPTARYIERITQLIIEVCGGQAGPLDDLQLAMPARQPVTLRLSRAQRVIGMPVTFEQVETVFKRLDRRRPDRRGGAGDRLRQAAQPRAQGPHHAAGAQRGAPWPVCAAPCRGRAGLPGGHHLQLRRREVGGRFRWQHPAHPRAQPHRQPAVGDALDADRFAGRGAEDQPVAQGRSRAPVRGGPRVHA